MGKGTRKGTRQVRMADDTKRKSAVTCLSRTLPSSSNAPNSHESAACLPWMSRTVLDPDPNWAPLSNTPAHSLSPLFFLSSNSSDMLEHIPEPPHPPIRSPQKEAKSSSSAACVPTTSLSCSHRVPGEWSPTYRWLRSHLLSWLWWEP